MYIYKITNKINNKIYIGQVYNKSIEARFARHIKEANISSRSRIGKAIAKYGSKNFICEQIDSANSLQELNKKEIYWIAKLHSTDRNIGYNLTPGGDGGNTYLCKTEQEMKEIKNKISISNSGKNNGMSKQIKALNVNTKEIIHFETLYDACKNFNHRQKASFIAHCDHTAKYLWRKEWTFAYENDEFKFDHLQIEHDRSCNHGTKVKVINLDTNEEMIFNSISKTNQYLKTKILFNKSNICFVNNFKLIKLDNKGVSTIPDECKGVGPEISTGSK